MSAGPPAEVTAYLRAATRLLPATARRMVAAELHANLHQAMLDARLTGHGEAEAWAVALQQAGPAWQTGVGLARIYTLPALLRAVLVTGALGGAASALWTDGETPVAAAQEARP
ncbi:hypothetical protein [Deinococcus hopiensis]|uniref:Uncharacterized protein n=1 Tax=Deinococcus hopiensis KR-140 TaxID=695939 RepID=A0A1W1VN81_9DEIO|nr:hypothetical protein [Deinococcus hopiensis]SMB94835.1 hypothetical protein SAMN00790413_02550 [Deinococcus hopiensis KR-140]